MKEYKEGKRGWDGYAITEPYIEGVEIESPYGTESDTPACYSFRHTLSKVINLLLSERLRLLGLWEHRTDYYFEELGQNPEPGSPRHLRNLIPIMVTIWAQKA